MARELSQEALLDFLCGAGGRVANAALLGHFRGFLRDPGAAPAEHLRRRELFKGFVNSVAAVRQGPDGARYVVLKRRFRDLLGDEGAVPAGGGARGAGERPPQPEPEPQPQPEPQPEPAGAGRAAGGTRGGPRWGSGGRGPPREPPGEPPLRAAPGAAGRGPARAPRALETPGARGQPRGDAPPASRSPPAAAQAAGRGAAPPARAPPPGGPLEGLAPGPPPRSTLQQQRQQRTREWVARHPQVPEAPEQGPLRVWSVLPNDFPRLPAELGFCVSEPNPALRDSTLSSRPLGPPTPPTPDSWPGNSPVTVFRSIRCQLALQDWDDFVDQESHSSEESSSGPEESPGASEEGLQVAPGTPDWRRLRDADGGLAPTEESSCKGNRGEGHASQQVLTGANGLADRPHEPLPSPAPRLRRSLRRSSQAGRASLSSSDEEHLEEHPKRSRRPPRSRKLSKPAPVSSPRVDAPLTLRTWDSKSAVAGGGHPRDAWPQAGEELSAVLPHRVSEHKSSLVPLDAREHEWIVKLASGSWIQALALFWQDPQLALHKDFLTGFTALHWMAKHGDLVALQKFVSGARDAGIALDVNVKSRCGYTPLHLAAIHGHQAVMKLLVQRLACRVNVRDHSGKKPWQYLTSKTSGEIWQLLEAPPGKPIFPVYPLVRSSSPTRKAKSRDAPRNVTRKTSLAALLKNQHNKWKLANQYDKYPIPREREEYSD